MGDDVNQRRMGFFLSLLLLASSCGCEIDPIIDIDLDDAGRLGEDDGDDEEDGSCAALANGGDPDKARVVLTGHSTKGVGGVPTVHFLRSALLEVDVGFTDIGERLDLDFAPVRIEFVPSGRFALVLGDEGELASVQVESDGTMEIVSELDLARFGMNDLRISSDGSEAFAVGADVTEQTSGVDVIRIGCDGALTLVDGAFFGLRLSYSLAFLPGEERAVLLGGQAVFEPEDDNDVRLLERAGEGFEQVGAFDLYGDHIDALRIAVSPDGRTLLVPNGSVFSSESAQVLVATIEGDVVSESHRVLDLEDAREALFSPDGQTALVTLFGRNRVMVLADEGAGLEVVGEVVGIGLAEQMALISRGALSGTVLVNSVDTDGRSNVARIFISGKGTVEDQGQLTLPEGLENIPRTLAVQP